MKQLENLGGLICAAKTGDNNAREEIYSYFKPVVRGIATGFFLIGGNADDLVQEGMIGLFEAIKDFDESKGNFYSFCQMCIRRNILTALSRSKREKNLPLSGSVNIDETMDLTDPAADPLQLLVSRDLLLSLREYIASHLTFTEQDVLKYYMKGYTYVEISTMLSKSKKAVDTALQRARKKLAAFKEN